MKKKLFSLICFLLVAMTVFASACGTQNNNSNSNVSTNDKAFAKTEIDLVKSAKTDYVIVIPENFTNYEEYAAQELVLYLKESTNATFNVINDKGITYDNTKKYISLGRTSLLSASGIPVLLSELGTDGYVIKRDGNIVFLCGGDNPGTLYSVYEFLYRQVNWVAYAVDEICYDKVVNLKLLDYDLVDVPAIPDRFGGFRSAATDPYFAAKWKVCAGAGVMPFGGEKWFYFGHSMFHVVPPGTYRAVYPDWYSADGAQPCFTSEGFKKQYITNAKKLFSDSATLIYLGIGLEDVNNSMCTCPNCQAEIDKYTKAGLVIRWANEVTAIMLEWAEEVNLGRQIYFPFVAYYETAQAPARKDPETGEYKPIDESCILNEFSPVIYARIDSDWTVPWEDDKNTSTYYGFKEWEVCCSSFMFYNYTNNFAKPFEWWDSIYVMSQNYGFAADNNGVYLHDDSSNGTLQGFAFQKMFGYISAKLLWDPNVDTNQMAIDFINNYFKTAKEEVMEYYYLLKTQSKGIIDEYALNKKTAGESNWVTRGVMDRAMALLRKGVQDIKDTPYYTEAEKDVYVGRVELELFTPLKYILDYLDAEYSAEAYLALVDEMEFMISKYGIGNLLWFEGQAGYKPNEEVIALWRAKKSI